MCLPMDGEQHMGQPNYCQPSYGQCILQQPIGTDTAREDGVGGVRLVVRMFHPTAAGVKSCRPILLKAT